MPPTSSPRRGGHRLDVDAFTLPARPGPGGPIGMLVLMTCRTCRLHARIVGSTESAGPLADIIVEAHQQHAARDRAGSRG